ncbi:MAG TPA: CPBP family glutamic-type intramembrane protease [Acidimicrobiales bacterium]|nr:CPBP family glutamic-type intramembrane protease [Acidimicrobiales bacterium]
MTPALARPRAAALVVVAGGALLLARPLVWRAGYDPTVPIACLFVAMLAVAWAWPAAQARTTAWAGPLLLGAVAFVLARLVVAGRAPAQVSPRFYVLMTLAAVAEEAFFRRLLYNLLLRFGPTAAVVGSALAFAAVHVTVYGVWVLPLDLAAGLVLGWQRHASGTWAVPAVTHVLANILVVI